MNALLFDVGGTNMRISVASRISDFKNAVIVPTPKRFTDGITTIIKHAHMLAHGKRITTVVGGIAGTLSKKRDTFVNSPHVSGWIGKPIKSSLIKAFRVPVTLENDADIVGLGEAVYGAGRPYRIVAYITVSTGIGGTRIVDRHLDTVAYGFEPGHMVIDPNGPSYHRQHLHGDLETMVSGEALSAKYHRPPYTITSPRVWRQQAELLAYGLVNVVVMWSPDVIVLGGSMFKKVGIDVAQVRRMLEDNLRGFYPAPKVAKGTLGDIGGLYGAFHLAKTIKRPRA